MPSRSLRHEHEGYLPIHLSATHGALIGMHELIKTLFSGRDTVTVEDIAVYFRISKNTVRRKMLDAGLDTGRQGYGPRHLTREQVERLFFHCHE